MKSRKNKRIEETSTYIKIPKNNFIPALGRNNAHSSYKAVKTYYFVKRISFNFELNY